MLKVIVRSMRRVQAQNKHIANTKTTRRGWARTKKKPDVAVRFF
jgi:hypothetical protein